MISRERAIELLDEHLENDNLRRHSIASAAVMKAFAAKVGAPAQEWELIGLLHDLDYDKTRENMQQHALETVNILKDEDFPPAYLHAISSHNEATGVVRETVTDFALAASESITGLIVACAMVYPDRRISSVKPKSIKKRMKEKAFARNVSRENILECEKAGVNFDDFVVLALEAMSEIQDEILT